MDFQKIVEIVKGGKEIYDAFKGDDGGGAATRYRQPGSVSRSATGTGRRPGGEISGQPYIPPPAEKLRMYEPEDVYTTMFTHVLKKYRTLT